MCCAIWYNLYDLKNAKNAHGTKSRNASHLILSTEIRFNFGFHVEIPTGVTVGRGYILAYQILIWKRYLHTKS